jgi:hypothetical protein
LVRSRAVRVALWVLAPGSILAAYYPVFDHSAYVDRAVHLKETMLRWKDQLEKTQQQLEKTREAYALTQAVYSGIQDWKSLDWVDGLALFELSFFDGVAGIGDVRDLAAGATLNLEGMQGVYREASIIKRMMEDDLYRDNEAFKARVKAMRKLHVRQMKRQVMFVKLYRRDREKQKEYRRQLKTINDRIRLLARKKPVNVAAITALQAQLGTIQAESQAAIAAEEHMRQVILAQEQEEIRKAQSELEEKRLDGAEAYWKAVGRFWDGFR